MDLINWQNLLTHPSEFIRIDEQLRLKQISLANFNDRIEGWNKVAGQENLEHQRMIYSMRCYLSMTGTNLFGVQMLSRGEYQALKRSFVDRENILTETDQDYANLNVMSQNEYWLILNQAMDRCNTERFYRKLLRTIIDSLVLDIQSQDEMYFRERMIDTIVTKCFFTVE